MRDQKEVTFALENFEGPLELLFHLVHKNEIDIYEVPLHKITDQFLSLLKEHQTDVDQGAEFIGVAASLLWYKSKTLLPKHEQEQNPEEWEDDPNFEVIHHLVEYCRFKQAAKGLSQREEQQYGFYSRGTEGVPELKKNLGIEHLTLDDLAILFKEIAAKAAIKKGLVHEEVWKVSDKIKYIRLLLSDEQKIGFELLFSQEMTRLELIVTFLAVLELMKLGEACVGKETSSGKIIVLKPAKLEAGYSKDK